MAQGNRQPRERRFTVALSFAGEKRGYVLNVAVELAKKLGGEEKILYDDFHKEEYARFKLDGYLPQQYREESELVVVFLCRDYDEKLWTGLEWEGIEKYRQAEDSWRVMLYQFADSSSTRLEEGDGCIFIDEQRVSASETVNSIIKRLRINRGKECDTSRRQQNEDLSFDPAKELRAFFELAEGKILKTLAREELACLQDELFTTDNRFKQTLIEVGKAERQQAEKHFRLLFKGYHAATKKCLNRRQAEQPDQDGFESSAKEIMGWLVLLSVRDESGKMARALSSAEGAQVEISLPLSALASVEIVASRLNEHHPDFSFHKGDLVGKNQVIPPLDFGPVKQATATAVKEAIWQLVRRGSGGVQYQPEKHDKELDGILEARKDFNEPYYIPVLETDEDHPLNEPAVYKQVLNDLEHLGAVFLCGGEQEIYLTSEQLLVGYIRQYLELFGQ